MSMTRPATVTMPILPALTNAKEGGIGRGHVSPRLLSGDFRGSSGWHWRLVTDMGQVIVDSSNVATREDCLKTLKWLRTHIENLPIVNAEGNAIA